jgi:hypothetical protein
MKVVSLCVDDYANFMYAQHLALKSVGVDSECYKLQPHVYKYPNQAKVIRKSAIGSIRADVFLIFHSHIEVLPRLDLSNNPQVIHVHTATRFRQNHEAIAEKVKDCKNIIALPEFAGLCANQFYMVGAIEPNGIELNITGYNRFAHYPSNPKIKGSADIFKCIREVGVSIQTGENVPYQAHMKRMQTCDVYIEMLAATQGTEQYGSFGMTALEAASMGKVVITNNLHGQELYRSTYGDCELVIANTKDELIKSIKQYQHGSTSTKALATYNWWRDKHSLEPTGQRLLQIIRA